MRLLVSCDDIVVLVVVDQAVVFLLVFFGGSYEDLADGTSFDSADGVLACEERMELDNVTKCIEYVGGPFADV